MNKKSLAATSLIAAIPAGILLFFGLTAFLGNFTKLPMLLLISMVLLLLVSAGILLLPAYLFMTYGEQKTKKQKKSSAKAETETAVVPTPAAAEQVDAEFEDEFDDSAVNTFDEYEAENDEFADEFEFDEEDDRSK